MRTSKYDAIVKLYEAGARTCDLAEKIGVSNTSMSIGLKRRGAKKRSPGAIAGVPNFKSRNPEYENLVAMYDSGMNTYEIARFFGVEQGAIWNALVLRGAKLRRRGGAEGEKCNLYRHGTPERAAAAKRAGRLVEKAIRNGDLKRNTRCSICRSSKMIQAHHEDYRKPLEVTWLCQMCHFKWHETHTPTL